MEERFEHLLHVAGFDVEAHGYSSWNSWQYQRIANTLRPKPGDVVFTFSMTNDFTPHYGNSTIKTLTKFEKINDVRAKEVDDGRVWRDYLRQSFFLNRVYFDLENIFANLFNANPQATAEIKDRSRIKVCPDSQDFIPSSVTDLAHDYVMLGKRSDCWSQIMIDSVDLNLVMLKRLKSTLGHEGAIVQILLVPAGWAFSDQNTVGRMAGDYQFYTGAKVSHKAYSITLSPRASC